MFLSRRPKIVATLLIKNEADIIAKTIEHHINQGVEKFIVTDNNSTDATKSIVEKYPEVVEIIDETDDTHNQSLWVTRMARLACKLTPDWIVHLDADELWEGLFSLRAMNASVCSCERMYLHPPCGIEFDFQQMRFYLDFDHLPIPQEAKVAHRPDPEITIQHGNHGVVNAKPHTTLAVYRHHFPIRSLTQWQRKSESCLSLRKRNSICARWEKWYNWLENKQLSDKFQILINAWANYRLKPNYEAFRSLLEFWATDEMNEFFLKNQELLPKVGEWYEK